MVKEIKVGIIVAVAILILVFGLRWLSGWRIERTRYQVELHFRNAGGLKRGDRVLVHGVLKGRVDDVDLVEDGVLVKIWLESDVILKEDASAEIETTGLIGGARLLLDPGKAERLYDGSKPISGKSGVDLRKLVVAASNILETTDGILKTLSKDLLAKDDLKRIDEIISALDVATKDFKSSATELKRLLGANRETLDESIDRIDGITEDLDSLLTNIRAGKGTAGKFLSDEELYEQVVLGMKELRELIADIKKNPRKYFRLF